MSDIRSLLVYISVLCLAAFLIHLGQKYRNKAIKISLTAAGILLPTLLGGLRYGVGADYHSYVAKMKVALDMNIFDFTTTFSIEPSVWILGRLSYAIFDSGVLFFFVSSFLITLFFYLGLKRFGVKQIGLAMLLILLVVFPQTLSGVRQGVAMALSFYAMSFIPDRKFWNFLVITLIASLLFHVTALALLFIYPLYNWIVRPNVDNKIFLGRLAVAVLVTIIALPLSLFMVQYVPFFDKFASYYTIFLDVFSHLAGTHNVLPEVFAVIFMIVFYKRIVSGSEKGRFAFLMTTFMLLTTSLGIFLPLAGRFSDFFMPVFLMAFSSVVDTFGNNNKLRILMILAIIGWALAFFVGAFFIKGSGTIFPYQLII